jgi:hypothetical protein
LGGEWKKVLRMENCEAIAVEYSSIYYRHINSVRTSQKTHYISAAETNRLMMFREIAAVYYENNIG